MENNYDARAAIALLYAIVRGTNAQTAINWAGGLKPPRQYETARHRRRSA